MATPAIPADPPLEQLQALIAQVDQGRCAEMVTEAERLIQDYSSSFMLWTLLGVGNTQLHKPDRAIAAYQRACSINPAFADGHYNIGVLLQEQGRLDDAAAAYQRAVTLEPGHADAHNSLGFVLREQGQFAAAVVSLQRALALRPDFAEAHYNLGIVLKAQGRLDAAVAAYHRCLALKPDFAEAHTNLGVALRDQGKLDEAIASYRRALAVRPDHARVEAELLHQLLHICDWQNYDSLPTTCARLAAHRDAPATFSFFAMVDDPAIQLQFSRKWAAARFRLPRGTVPAAPKTRPQRLRIGYFSADFYDHATLFLMAGLLREHDKQRFEIFAYSYGLAPPGEWGERACHDVDHFFKVAEQPSKAIVDLARSHALDIAIDLKGYTTHGRSDLFQQRIAPLQVNYLGYPGSMGTDFIDYLVADDIVIPGDQRAFYSESLIVLPHSYQPNDNARPIPATATRRADFGLPETGFVFCCFNNSYKIGPREFDIWMRVLGKVEGSVLWLLRTNRWCEDNLRRAALARQIDPQRLVFADPVGHADHLARHRHADLLLDCFNVNAHTTASDALWAGLPVVTRAGRQFAARVCASLLAAVGLPELIADTAKDYEALIVALATDPDRLARVRAKLASHRFDQPLFDTRQYARHFEAGLDMAYDNYLAGLPPRDIRVQA